MKMATRLCGPERCLNVVGPGTSPPCFRFDAVVVIPLLFVSFVLRLLAVFDTSSLDFSFYY